MKHIPDPVPVYASIRLSAHAHKSFITTFTENVPYDIYQDSSVKFVPEWESRLQASVLCMTHAEIYVTGRLSHCGISERTVHVLAPRGCKYFSRDFADLFYFLECKVLDII